MTRHMLTRKHKMAEVSEKETYIYICSCGKNYKHSSSLSHHKKKCENFKNIIDNIYSDQENINNIQSLVSIENEQKPIENPIKNEPISGELLKELTNIRELVKNTSTLIEQNQELKNFIIEQSKPQYVTINNNKQYNNFNLNIFLNEQCKDALNMADFINSLEFGSRSVEYTGVYGYVEGITKIFIDGLNQLDICKRPIHCTDLKRETLYIKEEDKWDKDSNEKTKLKTVINKVVKRNMQQLKKWQDENPRFNVMNTKEYELHLNIMRQSLGGGNEEKTEKNNEKIIKNISRHVVLNKTEFTPIL
jgi:hypothetical protein